MVRSRKGRHVANDDGTTERDFLIADRQSLLSKRLPLRLRLIRSFFRILNSHKFLHVATSVAVASSLLAIQLHPSSWLIRMASAMTLGFCALLLVQSGKLRELKDLRGQNNALRHRVGFLRQERERLRRTLDRMDERLADLQHIPKELHEISHSNKHNVDRLLQIVKQKAGLQKKMKEKINQEILQQIIQIVVRSDRDGNWELRPTEVEAMIVRLGMVSHVKFNEARFREIIQGNATVSTIMFVIRGLLEGENEFEHPTPIFVVENMV